QVDVSDISLCLESTIGDTDDYYCLYFGKVLWWMFGLGYCVICLFLPYQKCCHQINSHSQARFPFSNVIRSYFLKGLRVGRSDDLGNTFHVIL
ncbi:hypothetical protein DPEC_G00195870, partial [Dallia pectoralis]